MAAEPEQDPFDFLFETPSFDANVVAEQIVWPLVDDVTRRDWRKESRIGTEVEFPITFYDEAGRRFDVHIDCGTDLEDREDGPAKVSYVHLHIEEVKTSLERKLILKRTREAYRNSQEPLTEWSDSDLIAKSSVVYTFNTKGDCDVDIYQRVESKDGNMFWTLDPEESDADPDQEQDDEQPDLPEESHKPVVLTAHDLALLEVAVQALRAPESLKSAIEAIQQGGL